MSSQRPGCWTDIVRLRIGNIAKSSETISHGSSCNALCLLPTGSDLPPPVGSGRVGISPVKLTNHFLEANPPTTLTLDRRLTVSAAGRRSPRCRSPCFTISRKLALRLGRIVNPPQVLFLGSFAATFSVTLAAYLHNRVRETSSEQARTCSGRLRPPHWRSHRLW